MLQKLYDWMLKQASSPHAEKALALIAFAESSFFPIPPDVMLAPMVLAKPDQAKRYALITTIGSVLGGLLGYAIGYFLFDFGMWMLKAFGHAEILVTLQTWFQKFGVGVILALGLVPIPFKLITIASGLLKFNPLLLFGASIITRGARFFGVAYLFKHFGPAIADVIKKRFYLIGSVVIGLGLVAFIALKLFHKA